MASIPRLMPLILVILLGLIVQALLLPLDCKETPYQAAIEFTNAYYRLDPSMVKNLCADKDGENLAEVVNDYIYNSSADSHARGFGINWGKSTLYHVETHTTHNSETSADVHLTATRRKAINPLYAVVARIFSLGKTYTVDETIPMVKQDGKWKVCGPVFDLPTGT